MARCRLDPSQDRSAARDQRQRRGHVDEVPPAPAMSHDQAAGSLDRLSQRRDFTSQDDFVFVNRLGRRLDASAIRRRVERARNAAGQRPLRFHDSATPTVHCSSPAASTSRRLSPPWATHASRRLSTTCMHARRLRWPLDSRTPSRLQALQRRRQRAMPGRASRGLRRRRLGPTPHAVGSLAQPPPRERC